MLCAGATGVERFSIWIALPTDGSGCLLLNGDFGTSPLYRHLSGGNGPIRRKSGYIRHCLRTHGNIREDTALHTPCPFRVKNRSIGGCTSLLLCCQKRTLEVFFVSSCLAQSLDNVQLSKPRDIANTMRRMVRTHRPLDESIPESKTI
jgi:hypothetical protein